MHVFALPPATQFQRLLLTGVGWEQIHGEGSKFDVVCKNPKDTYRVNHLSPMLAKITSKRGKDFAAMSYSSMSGM